ncbi:winged helix DNA-binding domain-containing protein [Actinoplanes sp. NPDC051343]|uniref:winged helix DNA-binding domain-containing protein n=1 Tax=Actinoplanes sp. NPDC051343 TaxID=3363906 RepID=UPI0037A49A33
MRTITVEQRRRELVRRHHLTGDAKTSEQVVDAMVALHATDPASVYLSVLARGHSITLPDVSAAMYERRGLVRWMAMRRTLFVFAREDIPMIQSAVSTPLAATLRRRLLTLLERNGIEPPVNEDLPGWLRATEMRVEQALKRRARATGVELRADEPNLRATIPARTRSEQRQGLTSPLLTLMSAEGRIVRSAPVGAWTTRNHRWEPVSAWRPGGIPSIDPPAAQASLARRWLERFGPATVEDLEWWTGWNKSTTRAALGRLDLEEVDLYGRPGIDLRGAETAAPAEPVACLLPCLDPTPMGWKHRDWFTAVDPALIYDRAGNIGPTIWWNGELIGAWASAASGIVVKIVADRGREAAAAVEEAANRLGERIDGAIIAPAVRTPLERRLSR